MVKQLQMKMMLLSAMMLAGAGVAWADDTYVKVSSDADIVAGGEYILAETSSTKNYVANSTYSSSKYGTITSGFTINGDKITIPSSTTGVLVLTLGGSKGSWTLKDGTNYVGKSTTSNTNFIRANEATTTAYKWTIKLKDSEYAIFSNAQGYTGRYWGRNGSATGPYNDDSYPAFVMYKKKAVSPLSAITISGNYPTSFYVNDEFSCEGITVTATYEDASTNDVTNSASFSGYDMSTVGSQTVTVSYTEGEVTKTATYDITVAEIPEHTATFSINGEETTEEFEEGLAITFPIVTVPEGYLFMGWTTTELAAAQATAPADLTSVATMGNTDMTFYAVFAKEEIGEGAASLVISPSTKNIPGSYGTANTFTEYTFEGKKFKVQQMYKSGEKLQWRAAGNSSGTGTMYNTDALNKLQSVVLTYDSNDNYKNFTVKVGAEKNPTSGTSINPTTNGNIYTFDCSDGNYDYFVLTNGSNAGYLTSVTINYIYQTVVTTGYCTSVTTDITVKLNAYGFATFCSASALDFSEAEGYSAWQITDIDDNNKITFVQIEGSVAAGTGIFLKGTAGKPITLTATTSGDTLGDNLLEGTLEPKDVAAGEYYGLSGNNFVKINAGTVPTGKAILDAGWITESAGARFTFIFADATGISEVEHGTLNAEETVYDLQGRRVVKVQKGLYIVNGKKVMVK